MIRNEITTTINKPLQQVFDYLADMQHLSSYDPTVLSVTRESDGSIGIGSTWMHQRSYGPSKVNAPIHMLEFDPPRRFEYEVQTGGFQVRSAMSFEAEAEDVTRVNEVLEMTLRGFMRAMEPVLKGQLPKQAADVHQRMREVIEALPG